MRDAELPECHRPDAPSPRHWAGARLPSGRGRLRTGVRVPTALRSRVRRCASLRCGDAVPALRRVRRLRGGVRVHAPPAASRAAGRCEHCSAGVLPCGAPCDRLPCDARCSDMAEEAARSAALKSRQEGVQSVVRRNEDGAVRRGVHRRLRGGADARAGRRFWHLVRRHVPQWAQIRAGRLQLREGPAGVAGGMRRGAGASRW